MFETTLNTIIKKCILFLIEYVSFQVQVVFQHYVISNSERYFENAHKFQPERWLKCSKSKHHAFASLPFGYGRRMCLGRRFADLEIQTIIAKVQFSRYLTSNFCYNNLPQILLSTIYNIEYSQIPHLYCFFQLQYTKISLIEGEREREGDHSVNKTQPTHMKQ